MRDDPRYTYGCCEHCIEDEIHDLDENMHVIPCNSVRWPDECVQGRQRFDRLEEHA